MPHRRPPGRHRRGRHRRPKNSAGAPAVLTVAAVAAFAVGGVNVPGAIGASRAVVSDATSKSRHDSATPASGATAAALRAQLDEENAMRATRVRASRAADRVEEREAREAAKRKARAAEQARPEFVLPVLNYRLSAGFGETSYLWSSVHTGQDFAAPEGTPVRAVAEGTIIFAGWDGAYGNKVAIQHADGTVTWYAHLSSFDRTDGAVQAGDVIGRVGSTGNSTGAHLHFEVRPGGDDSDAINPVGWLAAHGVHI